MFTVFIALLAAIATDGLLLGCRPRVEGKIVVPSAIQKAKRVFRPSRSMSGFITGFLHEPTALGCFRLFSGVLVRGQDSNLCVNAYETSNLTN